MNKYVYYELIDFLGIDYYRWDTDIEIMHTWEHDLGMWVQHGWTPASLQRWCEIDEDATLNVVTEDDVR